MFVRRRQVWRPTAAGWLALALVVGLLGTLAGRHANRWLAVNEAARGPDGRGARTLVVEGWLAPYELDRAAEVFRSGGYERIVTTGGPSYDWPEAPAPRTYADRAAGYLRRHGLSQAQVVAAGAPATAQDRTWLSAVQVREWGRRTGTPLPAIDIFTGGVHARRSRMLYRMAFGPEVEVGALTARPLGYDPDHWWTSSAGVKSVLAESFSMAWTVCCFWPPHPPAGSASASGGGAR